MNDDNDGIWLLFLFYFTDPMTTKKMLQQCGIFYCSRQKIKKGKIVFDLYVIKCTCDYYEGFFQGNDNPLCMVI